MSNAHFRQASITLQVRQTALASSICWYAAPVFPTGKNLVDNMRRSGCVIGACGGAAAVFGILGGQVSVIGVAADETAANAVYVRPDSSLLKLKGENPG